MSHPHLHHALRRQGADPGRREIPDATVRQKVGAVLSNLPKLLALLWRAHPGLTAAVATLTVLPGALPVVGLYIQKRLVDVVAAQIKSGGSFRQALWWLLASVGIQGLTALTNQGTNLVNGYLQEDFNFHIRSQIAAKAQRLSLAYFDLPSFYDDLQRAQAGIGQRALSMLRAALNLGRNALTLGSFVVLLAAAHWSLVALLALVTVPAVWTTAYFARLRWSLVRSQTPLQRESDYVSGLLISRDVAKELRLFGLTPYLTGRWREIFVRLRRENFALQRRASFGGFGATLAGAAGAAAASGVLIWQVFLGRLTLGDFVALTQAVGSAQSILQGTAFELAGMYENALSASDLFNYLDLPEEATVTGDLPCPRPLRDGIRFEGVSFRYPESETAVLSDVSFTIRPGERVALVGENGAGKTTLVKLLMGLYQPSSGSITYDGVDLRTLDPASVRREVTVVFQDFARFDLTARENIGFGDLQRLDELGAVAAAADQGGARFLEQLPRGYDTVLGRYFKDGHELSYGQWQKVAISRAFFRDAQVVVLDEPTAALDAKAEAEVFRQFAAVAAGKSSLFISHRLGTARAADRILVLRQGRLVEQGTHEELMALDGDYARMYSLQAQWYI